MKVKETLHREYIYHGTAERNVEAILERGIEPRWEKKGNWSHVDYNSNPSQVYLTDVYSPYFAAMASQEGERHALIEVKLIRLDYNWLRPDEDALEQATRSTQAPAIALDRFPFLPEKGQDMFSRTIWFRERLEAFKHLWKASLTTLGTVGYRAVVPQDAITKVVLFDPKKNPCMALMQLDPSITIMNHLICYRKYAALTDWMMGLEVTPADFNDMYNMPDIEGMPSTMKEMKEQFNLAIADRSALEFVRCEQ